MKNEKTKKKKRTTQSERFRIERLRVRLPRIFRFEKKKNETRVYRCPRAEATNEVIGFHSINDRCANQKERVQVVYAVSRGVKRYEYLSDWQFI